VAGLSATAVGRFDDIVRARSGQAAVKGRRGHLLALADGRLTAGAVEAARVSNRRARRPGRTLLT
jgi:hypothetical protein